MTQTSSAEATAKYPMPYNFPVTAGSKEPVFGFKWKRDCSNDPQQFKKWKREYPGCNFGIATERSGLIVLDADTKPGKNGAASLAALESKHGPLPPTLMQKTPSGGVHYF